VDELRILRHEAPEGLKGHNWCRSKIGTSKRISSLTFRFCFAYSGAVVRRYKTVETFAGQPIRRDGDRYVFRAIVLVSGETATREIELTLGVFTFGEVKNLKGEFTVEDVLEQKIRQAIGKSYLNSGPPSKPLPPITIDDREIDGLMGDLRARKRKLGGK